MKTIFFISTILLAVIVAATARSLLESEKRLILINDAPPVWLEQDGINSLIREHIDFMDVTNKVFPKINHNLRKVNGIPNTIRFPTTVWSALTPLNIPRMEAFLTQFSGYHNRYYQSPTGIESSEWLYSVVNATISDTNYQGNAVVSSVSHPSWPQKSIIARIIGSDETLRNEIVILGAHLDSINSTQPADGLAQGADDNGSGSTVLVEAWRLILDAGFIPKRTVEFHWYAAEEVGLRGSLDIAETYYNQGVNVTSMVNFDVVGYYVAGRDEVALYTDYADPQLLAFMELVVENYLDFGYFYRACGSRCSDHVSWHEYGFPALFNKEAVSNPYMHTTNDELALVNFEQVAEFVKLAVGYAIEVSEPQT